jgi:large subunit ribosomal protein L6
MKKEIFQTIEIPSGIEISTEKDLIKVKGPNGELSKKAKLNALETKTEGDKFTIGNKTSNKKDKKNINTIVAHIKNMIEGVSNKFEYTLKVCFSHFPITVELKGTEAVVKNFLGEKIPRKVHIISGAEVKINKEIIKITSIDKEIAGQTAANFEIATKIRNRDRRVFQDGIFITEKAGRKI